MIRSFLVRSVPSDNDTKTNQIYLNPRDEREVVPTSHVMLLNDFPFTVCPHDQVEQGCIALNSIQRRLLNVSVATGSSVTPKPLSPDQPNLSHMQLIIDYTMASKKGGVLDSQEFTSFILGQFGGQYFRSGQLLVVMLANGMRLIATVQMVTVDPGSNGGKPGTFPDMGILTANTVVIVTPSERSEIILTNLSDKQLDAQQKNIVRQYNLENLGIGGLKKEFGQVFRRAFSSRMFPTSYVKKLGIKHVKGVLLHGPPGTGKTLIARKIGEILNCHEPKIVNGPEVFNKFVGGTEENVRKLFLEAEQEQASKGDQSQLHLIIFDEFDAICKQRGAVRDSTGVNDNVVNQLLSKIDGVNSLNNVLLIGMTNRLDLIDEAILRPGRFEVHVEIGLPDKEGREEIFRIHTKGMRNNGVMDASVDLSEMADLTRNYSGAEIEGVVRSATSIAFMRNVDLDNPTEVMDADNVSVTRQDFLDAIAEVIPAFGQAREKCDDLQRGGIIPYGKEWDDVDRCCHLFVDQLNAEGKRINHLAVLLNGTAGSGKSAVAAYLANLAAFPYVKVVSNEDMVGYGEMQKVNIIRKAFEDAYKSNASCIILDDLERLIDFSHLGGRYSNAVLQALLVLVKRPPPEEKKLLVIATTAHREIMGSLEIAACFSVETEIPSVSPEALPQIAKEMNICFTHPSDEGRCMDLFPHRIPIKQLLLLLEMSAEKRPDGILSISAESMAQSMRSAGVH